jgi:hypothetical protein
MVGCKHFSRCGVILFIISAILLTCPAAGGAAAEKAAAVSSPYRLWTDATGRHTTEARLADFQEDKVHLLKKDGKAVAIPLDRLSKADREYVGRWAGLKKKYPWLDANVPFDVVEYLKPIPDEENAAPLYRDALQNAAKLWDQYARMDEAWNKDPKSVNMAEVDAWLAEYETGFKKLALAQQRPACVFQTEYHIDTLLPQIQACRSVARVVVWQARRDAQRGEFDRPFQGVETVFRLSRDLRNKGSLIGQLVSITMDGICCQEIIPEILRAPSLKREHCDRLLAALAKHEAEAPDPFVEGNRTEFLFARNSFYDIQHGTGSFDAEHMKKMGVKGPADSTMARLGFLLTISSSGGRLVKEKYGKSANENRTPEERLKEIERLVNSMTAEDYAKEAEALSRVYASILALEGRTMLQRSRACGDPAIVEPLRNTNMALFLEPNFAWISACLRNQTALCGTQCLIALRRWQLEHKELPKDMATLIKAAGMKAVPIDPYSDQPLLMTVLDGAPVIYSVGPDGKDDKALVVWDLAPGHPGDYVFRLAPPR